MRRYRSEILLGLLLVATTLAVYRHACDNGFVNFDDATYVVNNPHVLGGLNSEDVRWAFAATYASNWHPLTWLSLQLDAQLQGARPRAYHWTNVLLHAANVVLLFLALRWLTGSRWRSAVVAALFAVHPLHVESVAWVAERKDVLSTLFGLLTLLGYAWYVERPGWRRYVLVVVALALGLMAKPMLVTLPFALLLLDYWPLGRWRLGRPPVHGQSPAGLVPAPVPLRLVLWEKVPLLGLSLVSSVVTWYAQQSTGAMRTLEQMPLAARAGNAIWSYAAYIGKSLWPVNLAAYYPHPGTGLAWGTVAMSALLLLAVTALVLKLGQRLPYLAVGWFWYLGTLVPVIGLTQAGTQAMADRFTYVPHIGLFILGVWAVADLAERWRCREAVAAGAAGVLAACMAVSWLQIGYWHDKISLWQRAVEATTDNAEAHYNLAVSLEAEGREAEALPHYAEALRIDPRDPRAHTNLGVALERRGRPEEARRHYEQALQAAPGYALAHFNLGTSLLRSGELKAAAAHLRAARAGHPNPAVVDYNLGRALAHQQQWEEAVVCFRQAVGLRPDSVRMHCSLAQALQHQGRSAEADAEYQEASRLEPDWPEASAAEAWFRATAPDAGRRNGLLALELAEQACQAAGGREPRYLDALAAAYAELGRFDQAVATADKAVGLAASGEQRQEMEDRLRLYKDRRPFRDARLAVPQPDGPVSGDSGR